MVQFIAHGEEAWRTYMPHQAELIYVVNAFTPNSNWPYQISLCLRWIRSRECHQLSTRLFCRLEWMTAVCTAAWCFPVWAVEISMNLRTLPSLKKKCAWSANSVHSSNPHTCGVVWRAYCLGRGGSFTTTTTTALLSTARPKKRKQVTMSLRSIAYFDETSTLLWNLFDIVHWTESLSYQMQNKFELTR